MKMRAKFEFVVMLAAVLALSGCALPWHSKSAATPPPQAQAPSAPHSDTPPPVAETKPAPPPPQPAPAETTPPPPPPPDSKPAATVHHRKTKPSPATPATADTTPPASATSSQTATATPPAGPTTPPTESAIGQLSAGDESSSSASTNEAVNLISSTERRLKAITRALTPAEQQTAEKVRTFLEQARQALHSQDIAAAHTLAIKANLLLDELQK